MRAVSDTLAGMLTGSRSVASYLSAYYDGVPVMDEVPITDGALETDTDQEVPGVLSASVPRHVTDRDGKQWDLLPTTADAPLAAEGTRLAVTYTVSTGRSREAVGLGWYRVQEWAAGDGVIEVTATSLEAVVQEARFLDPGTIPAGTTFPDAARFLVGGLLPLTVTAPNRTPTGGRAYEDDRLATLRDLVTAWPARVFVDDSGTLVVAPPHNDDTDPIVATLTDGENGTVVQAPRAGSRDGLYNAVKASGEADGDVAPVSAVEYVREGPRRWNGPHGNVPYFYSSPLLTTVAEARAAARTRLASLQHVADAVEIEAAPDPRLQTGDLIGLRQRNRTRTVRIDATALPLTAEGGTMTIRGHEVVR